MTYDKEFFTWWEVNHSSFYSSQPAILEKAMKDLAYQAWLAGQQSGIENGRELERELSNIEDNRYFH